MPIGGCRMKFEIESKFNRGDIVKLKGGNFISIIHDHLWKQNTIYAHCLGIYNDITIKSS